MTKAQQVTSVITWSSDSGIRERLALLAARGPEDCGHWAYDPHLDRWYRLGQRVYVKQEGSASLAIITECWHMDRSAAMELIGYPERRS